MQRLYETYESCAGAPQFDSSPLLPVGHTQQQAHLEVVLDGNGEFLRAAVLPRETTVVPATEDSAGRTSKPVPHPLCDKIQYCAGDYHDYGGAKEACFGPYLERLRAWQVSQPNKKVQAILRYVERSALVADLLSAKLLHSGPDRILLTEWTADAPVPEIFKVLTPKDKKRDQGDAFIRWRVEIPGDPVSAVWEDPEVRESWIRYVASSAQQLGLCMVTGERVALAENHPKRLRHGADGAKLLSSNDNSGFTFRGRFETGPQAFGVGSLASQKAHNALRWLIERQGYRAAEQVFIAWAINGKDVPPPLQNTAFLLGLVDEPAVPANGPASPYQGDAGQHYALRLSKALAGYRANLADSDHIVIMGLDSATPGRMAIIYYREVTGSEFLDRVSDWHKRCSWFQVYSKSIQFVGAPAPAEIAEAAYGKRIDDKLRKATIERLLPSIFDGRPLPRDLIEAVYRRACNRAGLGAWDWEKCLGIACALLRAANKENYPMALEEERTNRDYLYGRLLAIAENIELRALHVASEQRDTNAAKLMQRFSSHPYSTWKNLELGLAPYKARLRANRPAVLLEREKLLDSVLCLFRPEDFINDSPLAGEFLLAYHCQRAALWARNSVAGVSPQAGESTFKIEEPAS